MKRLYTIVFLSLSLLLLTGITVFAENSISVYRLYNNSTKEHLYTPDEVERESLVSRGWQDEDVGWVSASSGKNIYRLYNSTTRAHLFTSDENEFNTLTKSQGWSADFDGKAIFYSSGSIPVYRLYHEGIKQHLLTTDKNEYDALSANGWRAEEVAFYALSLKPEQSDPGNDSPSEPQNPSEPTEPQPSTSKVLVAYFSATQHTEKVAQTISGHLGADLYKITPEQEYTSDDLNYNSGSSRCLREQNDKSARPKISGTVTNMDQYSTIYLGYPIWFGQEPRIIDTFLESYNLNGKTIVPFCTSGSSGISASETNIKSLVPGANWVSGKRLTPGNEEETISWIDQISTKAGLVDN